jgi:hypothetical protein
MSAQPDGAGDLQPGWSRLVEGADGLRRSLFTVVAGNKSDRVELFHRTQRLADEGRPWFEGLAGAAVQHLTREITDLTGALTRPAGDRDDRSGPRPSDDSLGLSPEAVTQEIEHFTRRHFAGWCDESIPILGGQTPRQASATAGGVERVQGLLRDHEVSERQQAAAQGRPAVSYRFLWDALGISE